MTPLESETERFHMLQSQELTSTIESIMWTRESAILEGRKFRALLNKTIFCSKTKLIARWRARVLHEYPCRSFLEAFSCQIFLYVVVYVRWLFWVCFPSCVGFILSLTICFLTLPFYAAESLMQNRSSKILAMRMR